MNNQAVRRHFSCPICGVALICKKLDDQGMPERHTMVRCHECKAKLQWAVLGKQGQGCWLPSGCVAAAENAARSRSRQV